jgi:hypothetical protein
MIYISDITQRKKPNYSTPLVQRTAFIQLSNKLPVQHNVLIHTINRRHFKIPISEQSKEVRNVWNGIELHI